MCCVITYSLSRVLNYVLIGHTIYAPDVEENEMPRFVMTLHITDTIMNGIVSAKGGFSSIWFPGTIMYVS